MVDPQLRERLASLEGQWWHSLDLGAYGCVRGRKGLEALEHEWSRMQVPDLTGASVLDVGAWDGYFSFRAEREGAAAVTALDHFVWSIDNVAKQAYERDCGQREVKAKPFDQIEEIWQPEALPGKAPFDAAHEALHSDVSSCVMDFATAPIDALPRADVTFFLGVLYHLADPLGALRRLRHVTGGVAIIETEAILVPGVGDHPLWEFIPRPGFSATPIETDPTNWWAASARGLGNMLVEVGFRQAEEVAGPRLQRNAGTIRRAKRAARTALEFTVPRAMAVRRYRSVFHARP